jgi:manganese/zinc/iron transport system substrate-binding protein
VVTLVGLLLLTTACTPTSNRSKYPIHATATVGMVADLAREIGGKHTEVTQLIGSGVDPHLYKPSRDDVQAIMEADLVLYNGLLLEGKMAETLERWGKTKPSCAVASLLKLPSDLAPEDQHHPDPHVWMDVSLWSQAAQVVGDFYSKFDPSHARDYAAATAKLRKQLDRLHEYGRSIMVDIPKDRRVLITSHDAFRYFGRAYGLEVQAIQGISTESEAGLQRINQLVDLIVERKIEAVFIESSVPQESIEALLEGARSRGQTVKIGGQLYSDAMGDAGTYEGTYIGMMDHNLSTIARALGSTSVPTEGFRAKPIEANPAQ